ncbi:hypothetical protein A2W24_00730 [Microgenomates group bacterium RBG_16_45_19]|nr:MAG: hypothetical protein A2W24_00730 [Microgenomates group bacterium RBG_16_45_19]
MVNLNNKIKLGQLKTMSQKMYSGIVKAVVDIDKNLMVVDAGLHSDQERELLEHGSKQEDLWGINLCPNLSVDELIEFDSMINIRPMQGNNSRGVDDPKIRQKIRNLVLKLIL